MDRPFVDYSLVYRVEKRLSSLDKRDPDVHNVLGSLACYKSNVDIYNRRKAWLDQGETELPNGKPLTQKDLEKTYRLWDWFRRVLTAWSLYLGTEQEVRKSLEEQGYHWDEQTDNNSGV